MFTQGCSHVGKGTDIGSGGTEVRGSRGEWSTGSVTGDGFLDEDTKYNSRGWSLLVVVVRDI